MSEQKDVTEQVVLPLAGEAITVHCFFGCHYVAQSADPQEVHAMMERHYTERHAAQLERVVARMKGAR